MNEAKKAKQTGAFLLASCKAWKEYRPYSWIPTKEIQHKWIYEQRFEQCPTPTSKTPQPTTKP